MGSSAADVARAARLAAAISADDQDGAKTVLQEATAADALVGLALALAVRHFQICSEYYDTDCQTILDTYAIEAMNMDTSE